MLKAFDFFDEAVKIREYLILKKIDKMSACALTVETIEELLNCLIENPCEFDYFTVQNFCELYNTTKRSLKYRNFGVYLRQDRQRVDKLFEERFFSYINKKLYDIMEKELDPGFEKICGIKGGKLSGGQK